MKKSYDVVLIRHAQSLFNQATGIAAYELGLFHHSWDQLIQNNQFNKKVTYNSKYMDPMISEKGKKQCLNVRQQCSKIKPDLILVSPYIRALQTCKLLFGNEKVPIIVDPIFSQVFRFSCDVPQQLQTTIKSYPGFDFSKVLPLGNYWFLQNLTQQLQINIKKRLQKIENHNQAKKILLQLMSSKQIHEDPKMLRKRASQAKKILRSYKQKYSKIVVVAHFYMIQFIKSRGFNAEDEDLIEYHDILNCHPYYENLQQLQKIV